MLPPTVLQGWLVMPRKAPNCTVSFRISLPFEKQTELHHLARHVTSLSTLDDDLQRGQIALRP